MTYEYQPFPAFFYGPNGEAEIFNSQEEVPAGWLDDPNKFAQKSADAPRRGRPPAKPLAPQEEAKAVETPEVTEDEF